MLSRPNRRDSNVNKHFLYTQTDNVSSAAVHFGNKSIYPTRG